MAAGLALHRLPSWVKPNSAVTSRHLKGSFAVSQTTVFETSDFLLTSRTMPMCGVLQNSSQFQSLKTKHPSMGFETGYFAAHSRDVGFTPITMRSLVLAQQVSSVGGSTVSSPATQERAGALLRASSLRRTLPEYVDDHPLAVVLR